jgi:hypothetical protein
MAAKRKRFLARNLDDLATAKYEYNPNIDWVSSGKDKLPRDGPCGLDT